MGGGDAHGMHIGADWYIYIYIQCRNRRSRDVGVFASFGGARHRIHCRQTRLKSARRVANGDFFRENGLFCTNIRRTGIANAAFGPTSDAQVSQTVTFGMLFYPCQTFIRSTGVADGIFFLNICHFGLTSDAQVSQTLILHENPLNRRRKR